MLDALKESAAAEGLTRVRTVRLVVGQRHGALPYALQFAFEVLAAGSEGLFEGARLEIEERPTRVRCRSCGCEYGEDQAVGWALPCPACGRPVPEVLSGDELFIDYYEGEKDCCEGEKPGAPSPRTAGEGGWNEDKAESRPS